LIEQLGTKFAIAPQVLLDSGNISDNPSPQGDVKTAGLVEGMNRLGYRAANVGERDLVLGYDAFLARIAGAKFPFVSTNIVRKDTGKPVFAPYEVLEVDRPGGDPVRIGVLGVARFNPIFLKAGPDESNLVIRKPDEAVAEYLAEVREKSDVVVLLAALHKEDARAIVRALPGIDVVIGSYGGMYTTREEREGDTVLAYSGNQGKRIGETRLFLSDDGRIARTRSYLYFLTAAYPAIDAWTEYVATVHAKVAAVAGGGATAAATNVP
jgi:2',3'-cyclic-nucleotide 2'-phosphodiesterase (5'-nucleotidase family)